MGNFVTLASSIFWTGIIFILLIFYIHVKIWYKYVKLDNLPLKILSFIVCYILTIYLIFRLISIPSFYPTELTPHDKSTHNRYFNTWGILDIDKDISDDTTVRKQLYPLSMRNEPFMPPPSCPHMLKFFPLARVPHIPTTRFPSPILDNGDKNPSMPVIAHLYWAFCSVGQWKSIKRRSKHCNECPYFAKTFDLDESSLSWKEEFCPGILSPQNYPKDIKFQLENLNSYLARNDLYVIDLHILNLRIKNGIIKLIDGEVVDNQFLTLRILFAPVATCRKLHVYKDFNRIYWWGPESRKRVNSDQRTKESDADKERCPIDVLWDSNAKLKYFSKCNMAYNL